MGLVFWELTFDSSLCFGILGFFFSLLSLNEKRGGQHEVGDPTACTFSVFLPRVSGVY